MSRLSQPKDKDVDDSNFEIKAFDSSKKYNYQQLLEKACCPTCSMPLTWEI